MMVVTAQEILDKIERGEPVEYDHVIVKGDLDLPKGSSEVSPGVIKRSLSKSANFISSPIKVNDSIIEGNIYFNNTMFNRTIDFSGSSFKGNAYFGGSSFRSYAYFNESSFNGTAYFWKSSFTLYAKFSNSSFNGYANFWNSSFRRDVGFGSSTFTRTANFDSSYFSGKANFWGSFFGGYANFKNSFFKGDAVFDSSHFLGDVLFIGTDFARHADFWGTTFDGTANFKGSDFIGDVGFNSSSFNGVANFEGSTFNNSHFYLSKFNNLSLFNKALFNRTADFNSARFRDDAIFEDADFRDTLCLTWAKYDRLYVRWGKIIDHLEYDDTAYFALLENFKKLGYLEDYDACYYEYRHLHREQNWSVGYHKTMLPDEWGKKVFDFVLQYSCGYGKIPTWPLYWSAFFIIFFGVIWFVSGMDGHQGKDGRCVLEWFGQQNDSAKFRHRDWWGGACAVVDAMLFSATVFLSGTRLFVDPPKKLELEGRPGTFFGAVFILERVLGALFSILFFLAISGTVVR